MTPLIYLVRKSVKNTVKSILKSPGKLALWLITVAMIAGTVVVSLFTSANRAPGAIAPLFWFTGILFLFITLFVGTSVSKGLSGGDTIFEMSDVNLLFCSPVNPRKILLYGIVKMAKTAFLAGFFILFQATSLANFGVDYGGVLLTFAGYMLSMMTLLTVSLVIYSATNGKPRRKLAVKIITIALFVPLAVFAILQYLKTGDALATLKSVITSPFLAFIPVAGWTASGVTALISGHTGAGFLWLGANALLLVVMIAYILLSNPDYYEDVLVATETAYEKKRAVAEGNINAANASRRVVKVARTGIPYAGAASIFGKHVRESFRENRFGLLTLPSVLIAVGGIILAVIFADISILLFSLPWAQIFLIGTGRGLKDLYSHYIYMIPESSFKKIVWSNMEIIARTLIENVLMFGIAGLILRANILYIAVCIVVYTLFSYLLLGVNYAIMRYTGADVSSGMLLLIYYFAVILIIAPGVALAVIIGSITGGETAFFLGLFILSAWELLAGTVCFMLSRGVLHNCDMAMMKTK
ncbi:MAG: putative ABC exporter domain-containing protein [Clostridiales bacterium]|jgi:hypothetical protein|nr:putative ABC exporter domain-containing protein [Clostridiales bacterium]